MTYQKGRDPIPYERLYSVATGAVKPWVRASRKAVDFMRELDGFVATWIEPSYGRMLWFFDSKDAAIRAKNLAEAEGIKCGNNIGAFQVGRDGIPEALPPEEDVCNS